MFKKIKIFIGKKKTETAKPDQMIYKSPDNYYDGRRKHVNNGWRAVFEYNDYGEILNEGIRQDL